MSTNSVIDGRAVGFNDLFSQYTFTIPDFQRNFEWEKEDVGTFYTDICYARAKNQQYFFGPMVFVERQGSNVVEVIDGQQRLTAASILIAVIADLLVDAGGTNNINTSEGYYRIISNKTGNTWNTKISPSSKYQSFYKKLLTPGQGSAAKFGLQAPSNRIIEKNMLKAYNLFHTRLSDEFLDQATTQLDVSGLTNFYNDFLDPAKFIALRITVPSDNAAWQIFINLNQKGQDLQISTLVKAVLLSTIPDGPDREMYTDLWEDMEQELEGIKFDQFLHHYFVANVKPVQEKELYEIVDTEYKDDIPKTTKLIDDIIERAKDYRACVAPKSTDYSDLELEANLKVLKSPLRIIHAYSILLAGFTNYYRPGTTTGVTNFKKLVDWVLKYFIRERTICGEEPATLEKFASDVCKMIRDRKTPTEIKQKFIQNQTSAILFKESFKEKSKSTIGIDFYILSKINAWGYNDASRDLTEIAYKNRSVEHIMPKTRTNDWTTDLMKDPNLASATDDLIKEVHKSYLNKWGNLTPIHKANNTALLNKIFHEKNNHPKGYKQSNAKINKQIETFAQNDSSYPQPWWDIRSIDARTVKLADHAEQIFKVT